MRPAHFVTLLISSGLLAGCGPHNNSAQTKPAKPAAESTGITSTGALSALTEQNLGFAKGGQLTSVRVKVGDHVKAGQILASIDDVPARQALAQAKAQLRSQQALLAKIDDSPASHDAKRSVDQAEDILAAVRAQVAAQTNADNSAVTNAQQQLANDDAALATAASNRDSACAGAGAYTSNCSNAQSAYSAAQQKDDASRTALASAQQKRQVDQASGQVSIATAEQAVVTAKNAADLAKSDRPYNLDQQRALVAGARAAVALAQHDLDNTVLHAPVAGTVTALNGAVGEYLSPSIGTSALAPGTDAVIPGASGATSTGQSSNGATGGAASPARPGGTQFLVLSDIHQLQVVALFNESDAAQIQPQQSVDLTFDALPDVTATGTVVSVAPAATSVSGVISYYVTINVDDADSRLKAGQTANVSVRTGEGS